MSNIPPEYLDQIVTGDARLLAARIPDASVDLVLTDPPWSPADIDLFCWLSDTAARVLKPGGFVLTFCGKNRLDEVMMLMSLHLDFYWLIVGYQPESNLVFNPRRFLEKWRPALLYSKGYEPSRKRFIPDLMHTTRDKRFHDWGQGEKFWAFYMAHMSEPAAVVWEPFVGGGTVPAVAKQLSRHYIGFEIVPEVAESARQRVALTQAPLPLDIPEQMELTP